jgi:hypothetical protein
MIIVPKTAVVINRDHWAGWMWITKADDFKIIRFLYYRTELDSDFTLVHFRDDKNYEQFTDELDLDWSEHAKYER